MNDCEQLRPETGMYGYFRCCRIVQCCETSVDLGSMRAFQMWCEVTAEKTLFRGDFVEGAVDFAYA